MRLLLGIHNTGWATTLALSMAASRRAPGSWNSPAAAERNALHLEVGETVAKVAALVVGRHERQPVTAR